ncbi:MAG TPA: acyl carrier protein [Hyphomicrobium sp.]|nr:acyl carrier protein [Hyphomicrobium sp.]
MLARQTVIRPEITEIFRDVFEYEGPLALHTSPDDVDRWDSLQHIALVRAIEEMFAITLSMDEMMELDSAGAIENLLHRRGV